MRIDYTPKLTFDDVLLEPQYSNINSREEVDVKINFLGHKILPIISSNMDYVTDVTMARAMQTAGALGIINRFREGLLQWEEFVGLTASDGMGIHPLYISVGIRDVNEALSKIDKWVPYGVCIDVAHGDHSQVVSLIGRIRERFPRVRIIAGNVATADGFRRLAEAGADAIKVGIGPGSVCTTRSVTGVGIPQLSAIMACAAVKQYYPSLLIADGGINSSGDIVKAIAAGADAVMLGSLLAGHDECPGEVKQIEGKFYKSYQGQSLLGVNATRYAPEGVAGYVPYRGKVADTLKKLVGGMKSGFSYVGARNINELQERAKFITVSGATKNESSTRVLELA